MGNSNDKVIGIDLGTEYCCVAAFVNESFKIIPNKRKNLITPSYVAFTEDELLFGEDAKEQAHTNPTNTIFDVKRLIGRRYDDPKLKFDIDTHWPFQVVNDGNGKPKIKVVDRGEEKTFYAEQISGFLLDYLIETVQNYFGGEKINRCVVSVPAYFNDIQRQTTIDACKMAGLELLGLISEPVAASLSYVYKDFILSKGKSKRLTSFVIDLGGGTLDLSIQEIILGRVKVLGKAGDTRLGGNDFDQRILYYFISDIQKTCNYDIFEDKAALYLLTVESEKAKRHLSLHESYEIEFTYKEISTKLSITREKFEEVCEDLFLKIKNIISDFLESMKNQFSPIDNPLFDDDFTQNIIKDNTINNDLINAKKLKEKILDEFNKHVDVYNQNTCKAYPNEYKLGQMFDEVAIDLKKLSEDLMKIQNKLNNNASNRKLIYEYNQLKAIDLVILVGGSSKIPKLKSLLKEFVNEEKLTTKVDPEIAVACGALITAGLFVDLDFLKVLFENDKRKIIVVHGGMTGTGWTNEVLADTYWSLNINDSLPFSIGIEDYYGGFEVFLEKNCKFPVSVTKVFTQDSKTKLKILYDHNGIPSIQVKVYEGEEKEAKNNHFIGQLELKNFNVPINIEISIQVDACSTFTVQIKDISRWWWNAKVEASKTLGKLEYRLNESEIDQFKIDSEINRFLNEKRLFSNSGKYMMNYDELLKIFEKSCIKPINKEVLVRLRDLTEIGDKIDVNFEFPFVNVIKKIESVELLQVYKSQAKPKLLLCNPINEKVILKIGDNLFDDQICMSFLNVFNAIWQHSNQNFIWKRSTGSISIETKHLIFNKCYNIVSIDDPRSMAGLIEYIEAESAEKIWDRNSFLRKPQHKYNDLIKTLRTEGDDYARLMASAIGTFLSIFVLGIGDRHQGNMMVANDHSFFNIDFGFSFGETAFIDTADFPIPLFFSNYIKQSGQWENFIDQMWLALNTLMDYKDLFEFLAIKFIQDPSKHEKVKKTFDRTLNKSMFKSMFKQKVEKGSSRKLLKDITFRLFK